MMVINNMKICTKCKINFFLEEFGINKSAKDGLHYYCKICHNEGNDKWIKKNPKKRKEINRNYRKNNREKINIKARKHYMENVKEERKRKKIYNARPEVKEKAKEYLRKPENKERAKINRENNKKRRNEQLKKRRKDDVRFRLKGNISPIINKRLKNRLTSKKGKSTFYFLPYTVNELKQHLESKFKKDMQWDNYGEWHIDHIIPDSSFNYKSVDDKEFQDCWALSNLQPLWAEDNLIKSNKIYTYGQKIRIN